MAAPTPHRSTHELGFTVALSAEPAFAETAGALAARAGDYAGCASDDARRLGDAVREVFAKIASGSALADLIDVVVQGNERLVRVDVWCAAGTDMASRLAGPSAIDPVATLVDRVEFGHEGSRCYCRLTQQIRPSR
jgi:hypothetical protein